MLNITLQPGAEALCWPPAVSILCCAQNWRSKRVAQGSLWNARCAYRFDWAWKWYRYTESGSIV